MWADAEDRVESRPEPMEPALEELQDADLKTEEQTEPSALMERVAML